MMCFTILGMTVILSGVLAISTLNSVHTVLWLIMAFTSSILIFLLIQADFIALIFLIVYVGAIAILFLFVIMMLNFTSLLSQDDMSHTLYSGCIIGMVLLFEVWILYRSQFDMGGGTSSLRWYGADGTSNIRVLGQVVYFDYTSYFLLGSLILLVAMVGALNLTMGVRSGGLGSRSNLAMVET